MAKSAANAAAAALAEERAERELTADVNDAVMRTEAEIFADALGDEPLSDEPDTSLEEMGEGLEGDDLEGEEGAEEEGEAEQEAQGEQSEEGEGAEGEGEVEQGEQQEPPRDQRGRFEREEGRIPPRILREEKGRRREAESEAEQLRGQLHDVNLRFDNLVMQLRQPPPPAAATVETKPAPDMFADPDGYRSWLKDEAKKEADQLFQQRFGELQRQQDFERAQVLNANLEAAASGVRGYEFRVAYRDFLQAHDPRDPAAVQFVRQSVLSAPDPAKAIRDWWEQTSNPEYIEHIRDQIRQEYAPQQRGPQRGSQGRSFSGRGQEQQIPRHEVRLPRSLNGASGGGSQRVSDPEMLDGSEASIFQYGTRPSRP